MEILIGLGIIVLIAWLAIGPVFEPGEGWLFVFAVIPWCVIIVACAVFFIGWLSWIIGTLVTGGFSA